MDFRKWKQFWICALILLWSTTSVEGILYKTEMAKEEDSVRASSQAEQDAWVEAAYQQALKAYNQENWSEASHYFNKVVRVTNNRALKEEVFFLLGVTEFNREEYENANRAFSFYLKNRCKAHNFFSAIEYKFRIAERLKAGAPCYLFSSSRLPKWGSGYRLAIDIYDEIVLAVPSNDLAIKSLYAKSEVLTHLGRYREAIDNYQIFIRRFPNNPLVSSCYFHILECHQQMAYVEYQNPEILSFAQLFLEKFARLYPRDERLPEAKEIVQEMKEYYAYGLCELGSYYERHGYLNAAAIYYHTCLQRYPDADLSAYAKEKLQILGK